MDNNELTHHGILGMRWGIIRTPEQLAKARGSVKKKPNNHDETIEQKKEKILKSRSAKELYKNADLFTYTELSNAYNRLLLEQNISRLAPAEISKGKKFVDGVISTGKKMNDLGDIGTKTYNHVARVYNTFSENGKKKPLPIIDTNTKKKK